MFRGHRGILAALGIAAVITAGLAIWIWPTEPILKTYHYEDARTGGYQAGGESCQPAALAAIRDERKAARERAACAKEAEEERLSTNDLIQQTRAADAAEAQAVVANQAIWMVFLQTIGGLLTLFAAGAAAVYARDAAQAARDSLRHAERTSEAELRPWLEYDIAPERITLDDKQMVFRFRLQMKNIGKTAAFRVRYGTKGIAFGPKEADLSYEFFDRAEAHEGPHWERTLLPGGTADIVAHAYLPRDEFRTSAVGTREYMHLEAALNVLYEWNQGESRGQTSKVFLVGPAISESLFGREKPGVGAIGLEECPYDLNLAAKERGFSKII